MVVLIAWSDRPAIGVGQQRVVGRVLRVAQPHAEHHKSRAEEEEEEEQPQASGHGSVSRPAHLSVVGFDVVAKESAWFGSARVRKFIHVDREEVGKLGRGRLGLLGNAPRAIPSRGLLRYPARRPRRGGGTRCGPSDDQVSAPTEMVLRINMKKEDEREFFPTVLFP
ncbi:hypothetical protein GW17_00030851 [Ensete ventricosum]|uniref:Uncharacterized protein n=1 Tax=Ensete ventricosum TaxID=4639 RepID=A0A444E619_ENSVE|nr:hypothetical protein GW17_00030851 [Ensete ventricosum]RZR73050.1 hypothetical protein BHM03_00019646 [Ensete ventricosum]